MSVCQGYQSINTSQCSIWNVLVQFFSNMSLLQNHLESLLKHRLCVPPQVSDSVALGCAREFTFPTSSRSCYAAVLDTTLRSIPLVYMSESLNRIDNFKKYSQLKLPKILHVFNEIILVSNVMGLFSGILGYWMETQDPVYCKCGVKKASCVMLLSALSFYQTRMG